MSLRSLALSSLVMSIGLSYCTTALATNGPGDNWTHENPEGPEIYYSTTQAAPGSVSVSGDGTEMVFTAVDAEGQTFTAHVNGATREITATNGSSLISNQLTPQQWQLASQKYGQAQTAGAAIYIVPVVVGAGLCYINDNITKHRMIKHCERQGGTVVMEDSGFCGMGASYHCEHIPPPEPRTPPKPTPGPVPGPGSNGFWMSDGMGSLIGVTASTNLSVWTYDSDWFGAP
ncbi:hypothetical protein [Lysobacter sp. Root916]|uniref:hypothetical protein n=1 Tax=Lysobacter sp. Root916 TaxID=1736606 RepID=UPI000A9CCAAB|nr:hypothetical protein [Lysobacter sp. Root916]